MDRTTLAALRRATRARKHVAQQLAARTTPRLTRQAYQVERRMAAATRALAFVALEA